MMPFTRQPDPTRGATEMPVIIMGAAVVAVAVALQYFLVFRAAATAAVVTLGVGLAAYFLTRMLLGAYTASMRFNLGLLSAETGTLYKEIQSF